MIITMLCPLWVAAERICATMMIKTYADRTANVGIWLALGTHIFAFTLAGFGIYYDLNYHVFDLDGSTGSCQVTHLHPALIPVLWAMVGIIFTIAAVILVFLYQHNIKMKAIKLSTNLTARYQYSENVRTLRFLVPAFVGLGSLNLLAALTIPYIYIKFAQGQDVQLMYQALYLIPVGYGVYFIIYVFFKYEVLRKALKKDLAKILPCFFREKVKVRPNPEAMYGNDVDKTTDLYWKQFDNAWQKGPAEEKKQLTRSNSAMLKLSKPPRKAIK
uniref:G_PROTEIN_RECEP_F1_2 domain-containing protein n=2 Tax=Bursaphelenchus xylophilus TaxID=6326 RepID=A0A1I7SER6_BURXY